MQGECWYNFEKNSNDDMLWFILVLKHWKDIRMVYVGSDALEGYWISRTSVRNQKVQILVMIPIMRCCGFEVVDEG